MESYTLTANGALTYNDCSDKLVNLWFKLGRNSRSGEIEGYLRDVLGEERVMTWRVVCALRNFRDIGKGERDLYICCLEILAEEDVESFLRYLPVLMDMGRMDDLWKLGERIIEKVRDLSVTANEYLVLEGIVEYYGKKLGEDLSKMEKKEGCSLLAKWVDHQKKGLGMSILVVWKMGLLQFGGRVWEYLGLDRPESFERWCEFFFIIMHFPSKLKIREGKSRKLKLSTLEKIILKEVLEVNEGVKMVIKTFNYGLGIYRRKYVSPLNRYVRTLEVGMCNKTFVLTERNVGKLPALAVKKYQKYFGTRFPETYLEIMGKLMKGEIKLKGITIDLGNFAKEYFEDDVKINSVIESQFETLLERMFEKMIKRLEKGEEYVVSCAVSDISGSMMLNVNGVVPLRICAMMSLMMMKLNILGMHLDLRMTAKEYVDMVFGRSELRMKLPYYATHGISFSEEPQFYEIPYVGSLRDNIDCFMKQQVGYSTNFYGVFELINGLEEKPRRVVAFTDGQFNRQTRMPLKTTMEAIRGLCGEGMPELVYWNIAAGGGYRTVDERDGNLEGFSMLSGYNMSLGEAVLVDEVDEIGERVKMSPKNILLKILNHAAFSGIC